MGAKVSRLTTQLGVGLSGDFDQCGTNVESLGVLVVGDTVASGDGGTVTAGFVEGVLHGVEGALVDERADEGAAFAWVADDDRAVDLFELGDELVVDIGVDDEAAEGGAALACGAHGREGDGAEGEVEVGRGGDDGCVVAAEFEDGLGEARGEFGRDGAAHGGRSGGGDERDDG